MARPKPQDETEQAAIDAAITDARQQGWEGDAHRIIHSSANVETVTRRLFQSIGKQDPAIVGATGTRQAASTGTDYGPRFSQYDPNSGYLHDGD